MRSLNPKLFLIPSQKKHLESFSVFCDGGARGNPGPAAAGFLVKDPQDKILVKKGKYIGKTTNNVAEYQAVIEALEWLRQNQKKIFNSFLEKTKKPLIINFYLDSLLVVSQLNGKFKIKNLTLKKLAILVKQMERKIKTPIFYFHIFREKNKEADSLVNKALDNILK